MDTTHGSIPSPLPVSAQERNWATIAHLSAFIGHFIPFGHIIGPLAVWLLKRDSSAFVADQAKEALNAQLSVTAYASVAGALCFIVIGFPLLFALWLADVVFVIIAAVAAGEGRAYRYPLIFRLVN